MGVGASYDRTTNITKKQSELAIKQYYRNGVFTPRNLKKNVFTIIAKDNIDQNARSNTATTHYHGIRMTVMQFPTNERPEDQSMAQIDIENDISDKNLQQLPPTYLEVKPAFLPKGPLYAPVYTPLVTMYDDNELYDDALHDEYVSMNEACSQLI